MVSYGEGAKHVKSIVCELVSNGIEFVFALQKQVAYEKFSKMPRHNPKLYATHHNKKGSPVVSFEVVWKVPISG